LDNNTKFQTAVHESGHIFMFIYLGHTFSHVTISQSENLNYYGRISGGNPIIEDDELQNFIKRNFSKEKDRLVRNIMNNLISIFLAGYETEKLFQVYSPDIDNEFKSFDYNKAWELAQAISVRNSSSSTMEVVDRSRKELRSVLLENQSILKRIANELVKFDIMNYDVLKGLVFSR